MASEHIPDSGTLCAELNRPVSASDQGYTMTTASETNPEERSLNSSS